MTKCFKPKFLLSIDTVMLIFSKNVDNYTPTHINIWSEALRTVQGFSKMPPSIANMNG